MYRILKIFISILLLVSIWMIIFPNQFSNIIDRIINAAEESPVPQFIRIVGYFLGSLSTLIAAIIIKKEMKAKRVLNAAKKKDSFWDEAKMKYHARAIFYKIQEAKEKQDLNIIHEYCTSDFKPTVEDHIIYDEVLDITIIYSAIDVNETRVIGCEDYKNNTNDRFIAYLSGKLRNTVVSKKDENLRNGVSQGFSETYHFVRSANKWLLENIDSNVDVWDLLSTKSVQEK